MNLLCLYNPDMQHAERYSVVILNAWKSHLIPALRAANPDVKVLLSKNAAFLREDDNASTVGGFNDAPESWFLHDAAGDRITWPMYESRAHAMNPANVGWRDHWYQIAFADAYLKNFDGVFADDVWCKRLNGTDRAVESESDLAYYDAIHGLLEYAHKSEGDFTLHKPLLLVANLLEHLWFPDAWRTFLTVTDGLMHEHFASASVSGGLADDRGDNWWLRQVESVEECERQGKMGLFVSRGLPTDLPRMEYCWASWLLGAGQSTHWAHYGVKYDDPPWFEEWAHDFGNPDGLRETSILAGAWQRVFANGSVSVDPRQGAAGVAARGVDAARGGGGMTGAERITAERLRQKVAEGWTASHDAQHRRGELVDAALCYLRPTLVTEYWPWNADWWKPSVNRIRNLEKAGALIAAEIDRLLRHGEVVE